MFLAPSALGIAILGIVVGTNGRALREHGPTNDKWVVTCFIVAALLFLGWLACIVRVWTTRGRDDEPIPPAKTILRPR
ncbi:MAG: hypothetical protein JWP01_3445 [Myxococcales bacterium]|nr:hypothetical protein [Myxococcales bacterium]